MPSVMTAPDGWRVEQIEIDGRPEMRVTRDGYLVGGLNSGRLKDRGVHFTPEAVAATMGDAFVLLQVAP